MANVYKKNQSVRITGTFTVSSVNTDPTTITLKVRDPSGNIATYTYALAEVTKSATGVYYKDITTDESGQWFYNWIGTGTVAAADEDYFEVTSTVF